MGLTALQKSLVDLQTAILAQVGVGSTELLLVRKDVDVLISYFKFVGLVVSDLLKLSADASIPVARVFALLMADTGAVAKFVTDSHPETSGMNLDMSKCKND